MSTKYAKDGYIPGAGIEMSKVMTLYKIAHLIKSSGISRFFWKNYSDSLPVPPSIKKKIIKHMKKHLYILERAIQAEEAAFKE